MHAMDLCFTQTSSTDFTSTDHTIGPLRPPAAYHLLTPLIFHFCFILLFHILNLDPNFVVNRPPSDSIRLGLGLPTHIYNCRTTCRYSVRISTWFSQSLSDSKSNLSLSKSAASAPLDYLPLSKPSLSTDSVTLLIALLKPMHSADLCSYKLPCLFGMSLTVYLNSTP